MTDQEIMTAEQVAKMLGRSKKTIYMMVLKKQIPHYKPNRKSLYFRKSEVEAWAFGNKISAESQD
jgi:excisionase family DNA binding protein